jgi:hypothetical protein
MENWHKQHIRRLEKRLAEVTTDRTRLGKLLETEQRAHVAQVEELQKQLETEVHEVIRRQELVCAQEVTRLTHTSFLSTTDGHMRCNGAHDVK